MAWTLTHIMFIYFKAYSFLRIYPLPSMTFVKSTWLSSKEQDIDTVLVFSFVFLTRL